MRTILEHVFASVPPASSCRHDPSFSAAGVSGVSGSNWKTSLNPQQLAAVTAADGPVLVIAGAGTGKTWTLACRVAYLIEHGVPPERILLLTFSRRAAREMLSRAGRLVDTRQAGKVWGGTFHATANRLLR